MRVLVVDDSSTMRTIICSSLKQSGDYEFETACDGEDALSKAAAFKPELVLLDWNMPKMNGLEFLVAFRATGDKAPVIMVTTESEKPRVIDAIKAGANDYVVKPFTPEGLSEHIARTLAKVA